MTKVMVVEDNISNMKLAAETLKLCGFEVCEAANAAETLDKISSFLPQVILMDIQLPDVDGLTLTRQIKSYPQYQNIFIIAMTAYAMEGDKEKTLAAGCDEYVAKPADMFDVIELINKKTSSSKS